VSAWLWVPLAPADVANAGDRPSWRFEVLGAGSSATWVDTVLADGALSTVGMVPTRPARCKTRSTRIGPGQAGPAIGTRSQLRSGRPDVLGRHVVRLDGPVATSMPTAVAPVRPADQGRP